MAVLCLHSDSLLTDIIDYDWLKFSQNEILGTLMNVISLRLV